MSDNETFMQLEGVQEYIDRLTAHWQLASVLEKGVVDATIYQMAGMYFAAIRTRMRGLDRASELSENDEYYVRELILAAAAARPT
jgi:hypothetical protein